MGKIIAIFNQKGGVGKTTTHINLSAALSILGKEVLAVDIDPQGNTTSGLGIEKNDLENSIYDVIIGEEDCQSAIISTGYEKLKLLPANIDLAGAEVELTGMNRRELCLKDALETIRDYYDYIFIDCPPSLGLLTINALAAADTVLIPIQCEYYALEGVGQLMNTVSLVKQGLNTKLEIEGVIMTMYDGRTNLSAQVMEEVKDFFKKKVYDTYIPRNVRLAEAPSYGETIFDYESGSKGAKAYLVLAEEFIKRQA